MNIQQKSLYQYKKRCEKGKKIGWKPFCSIHNIIKKDFRILNIILNTKAQFFFKLWTQITLKHSWNSKKGSIEMQVKERKM